jgi:ubiquitin fusion degradation protein 1
VRVQYTKLSKGNYVKLRPQTKDFLDISNPKAVLETTLRSYTCLTVGDSILINYNNKRYFIDIVEARPNDAVSIVDTDCEVDFAPPLDYVEPVRSAGAGDGDKPGEPMDLGGDAEKKKARRDDAGEGSSGAADAADAENEKTFLAFAGGGNRLDGKAARADLAPKPVELPTTSLKLSKEFEQFIRGPPAGNPGETKKESDASASGLPRRKAGKLVFGGAGGVGRESRAAEKAKAPEKKEEKKEEKAKFTAFQGSGNKLK